LLLVTLGVFRRAKRLSLILRYICLTKKGCRVSDLLKMVSRHAKQDEKNLLVTLVVVNEKSDPSGFREVVIGCLCKGEENFIDQWQLTLFSN